MPQGKFWEQPGFADDENVKDLRRLARDLGVAERIEQIMVRPGGSMGDTADIIEIAEILDVNPWREQDGNPAEIAAER